MHGSSPMPVLPESSSKQFLDYPSLPFEGRRRSYRVSGSVLRTRDILGLSHLSAYRRVCAQLGARFLSTLLWTVSS